MRINDDVRLAWGKSIREQLEGYRELHAIVGERIARQETIDAALREALDRVGQESSAENDALGALSAASEEAAKKLRLLGIKLEQSYLEGKLEEESYRATMAAGFPKGTGMVGGTPGDRHAALGRLVAALEQHPGVDPDGSLRSDATQMQRELESRNDAAKKEASERQQAHESLGQARVAWDDGYTATKEIVSGLLRDAGQRSELAAIFPDVK